MSYVSSADFAVMRRSASSRDVSAADRPAPRAPGASPVGPMLEIVLLVGTSLAVSLVFCTALAGAWLG